MTQIFSIQVSDEVMSSIIEKHQDIVINLAWEKP